MKIKTRVFLMISVLLITSCTLGNETSNKQDTELQTIQNQLKAVLSNLGNEVSFKSLDSELFEVSYHTRKFMVHSGSRIGKFSEDIFERVGPDNDGFLLKVYLQDKGTPIQANTPQTIKEPYWNTYLDVTQLTGTDKQIYWGLSYWSHTDQIILSQIKETLWKLDKSRNNVSLKAQQIVNQGEELTGRFKKNKKSNSPYRLELIGGASLNLRGKILENLKEDTMIWVTGQIHTKLYRSNSPQAAMPTQWDVFLEVEDCKEISQPFEIPKPD